MQAVFDSAETAIASITQHATRTAVYRPESVRLARYVCKLALVLRQLELQLHVDGYLEEDPGLFESVQGCLSSLRSSEQLLRRCAAAARGSVWPLEDAVGFQSCAAELCAAVVGLTRLRPRLPADLAADVEHFASQFASLAFTVSELEETGAEELTQVQRDVGRAPLPGSRLQEELSGAESASIAASSVCDISGSSETGSPRARSPAAAPLARPHSGSSAASPRAPPAPAPVAVARDGVGRRTPLPEDPFNMTPRSLRQCTIAELEKMQIDKEGRRDSGLQDASGADTSAASSSKGGTTTSDMATGGTERVEAAGAAASAGGHGGERGDADTSAPPAPPAD